MSVRCIEGLGRLLAVVLVGVVLHGRGAAADTFSFTYLLSDGTVLGGVLTGTLQPDQNSFDVSGYTRITFNGTTLTYVPTAFEAYSEFYAGHTTVGTSGVVTLDGSYENFIDEQQTTRTGFDFIVNVPGINFFGGRDVGVFGFSSLRDQPFVAANLHATVTTTAGDGSAGTTTPGAAASGGTTAATAVPEPSTTLLLGFSAAGLVAARRRRLPWPAPTSSCGRVTCPGSPGPRGPAR